MVVRALVPRRRILRRLAISATMLFLLLLLAVGLDRASLSLWRWRVHKYHEQLQKACEPHQEYPTPGVLLSWGPRAGQYPVATTWITLKGPRPTEIMVTGDGGLNLLYTPPYTAWSRYVPYLLAIILRRSEPVEVTIDRDTRLPELRAVYGGDYPYNDVYVLTVTTTGPDGRDLPRPSVRLDHGL